jgi:hypothetical protein
MFIYSHNIILVVLTLVVKVELTVVYSIRVLVVKSLFALKTLYTKDSSLWYVPRVDYGVKTCYTRALM